MQTPGFKKDSQQRIDNTLPEVEFINSPQNEQEAYNRLIVALKDSEWLPVHNNRCLCLDIVANISVDYNYNPRLGVSNRIGYAYPVGLLFSTNIWASYILTRASDRSHLRLRSGQVRVSILDPLRQKTLFDRENAADFDWQRAGEMVAKQDPDTVGIDLLGSERGSGNYLHGKFQGILEDGACSPGTESPLKIVIVVGNEMRFAKHTAVPQLDPQDPGSAQFLYFCYGDYRYDDIFKILKRTKPQRYTSLEDLISYIEKLQ